MAELVVLRNLLSIYAQVRIFFFSFSFFLFFVCLVFFFLFVFSFYNLLLFFPGNVICAAKVLRRACHSLRHYHQ